VQWKTIGEQEQLVQHSVRNVTLGKKNDAEVQWKTIGEQELLVQHSVRNVTLGKKKQNHDQIDAILTDCYYILYHLTRVNHDILR
jgi:hypothetical protein